MASGIGPHEGRELELLLSGEKPVARFSLDGLNPEYELKFRKAVQLGHIKEFEFENARNCLLNRRYYCLPTEEWRVKLIELINSEFHAKRLGDFTTDDLHRIEGTLLGYEKADIEKFIEHWRLNQER